MMATLSQTSVTFSLARQPHAPLLVLGKVHVRGGQQVQIYFQLLIKKILVSLCFITVDKVQLMRSF